MLSPAPRAVVLDLYDTLVVWDPERLPELDWRGRKARSTIPWILPVLKRALGAGFSADAFIATYNTVLDQINAERERDAVEITCLNRFSRTLERIGYGPLEARERLADELKRVHMAGVRSVTFAPARRVAAVSRLAARYRLGLLSNFDDAATGRQVLADTGVAHLFEAVVISAEVGVRKPNPLIYGRMLAMLGQEPQDVLFAGDAPREDVAGPRRALMRAAWVNPRGERFPEAMPAPDLVVTDLAELADALGC